MNLFYDFFDEFFDEFFDDFSVDFFTYNLLTIANSRIGVPLLLFFYIYYVKNSTGSRFSQKLKERTVPNKAI